MTTPSCSVFVALTTTVIEPAKLFDVFVNSKTFLPIVVPDIVSSVDYIEGHGEPGTIMKIVYANGTYGKENVDIVKKEDYQYKYSVIEGAPLGEKFNKISAKIKIEAINPAGTPSGDQQAQQQPDPKFNVSLTGIYETKDNKSIKPEELQAFAKKALELLKRVEVYLQEHPNALLSEHHVAPPISPNAVMPHLPEHTDACLSLQDPDALSCV